MMDKGYFIYTLVGNLYLAACLYFKRQIKGEVKATPFGENQ
jgi:hypothetical protein